MTKMTYNANVGIEYFFELFKRRKITFAKGFFLGLKTRKKRLPVEKALYKRLVGDYLDAYFADFFKENKSQYFMLSGELVKTKGRPLYSKEHKINNTESLNWIWYLRPALNYVSNIKLVKLKGSGKKVQVLENAYRENFDVQMLSSTKERLHHLNINNKLYVPCKAE